MLIPVDLFQIVITDGLETQVIVLRERNGSRTLPIFIGVNEARAIERKLKEVPLPRPLTHDLILDIIDKMGGNVSRIVVNDLRDETYFAFIEVRQNGEAFEIDSRPSDAIAVAVRTRAPIFVEEKVIERTLKAQDAPK